MRPVCRGCCSGLDGCPPHLRSPHRTRAASPCGHTPARRHAYPSGGASVSWNQPPPSWLLTHPDLSHSVPRHGSRSGRVTYIVPLRQRGQALYFWTVSEFERGKRRPAAGITATSREAEDKGAPWEKGSGGERGPSGEPRPQLPWDENTSFMLRQFEFWVGFFSIWIIKSSQLVQEVRPLTTPEERANEGRGLTRAKSQEKISTLPQCSVCCSATSSHPTYFSRISDLFSINAGDGFLKFWNEAGKSYIFSMKTFGTACVHSHIKMQQ